jgi:pyruvate-formate lyase
MNLVRIPTEELEKVWSLVEKDIRQALAYSSQLTDSNFVFEIAKQNKFQIWVLWDKEQKEQNKYFGVVVTEIIKRKLGKVCHIYIMTGRQRHKWQYLIKDIEEFAKNEGCLMMELIARPGWQKVLNNFLVKVD